MKSLEIKKKYEEKLKRVEAVLLYKEAKELCDLISDKKLSYIINKYPKLFACISSMNEDNCWENPGCIVEAINLFRDVVDSDGLTQEEYKDMLAPIIQLNPLTYEEMLILIEKVADIHATLFDYTPKLTQEDFISFIQIEYGRVGASTHLTPREVIRDFIELLNILYQNPSLTMKKVFDSKQFEFSSYGDDDEENLFTELEI